MKQLWFKQKTYGWGWTPATWQGWAVIMMYVFSVVVIGIYIDRHVRSVGEVFITLVPIYIQTVFLIIICYATGEKPEWRWGKKK